MTDGDRLARVFLALCTEVRRTDDNYGEFEDAEERAFREGQMLEARACLAIAKKAAGLMEDGE